MNTIKGVQLAVVTILLSLFSVLANAIAITDVTYEGQNADDAKLVGGNDNVAAINGLYSGDPWTLLAKSDDAGDGFSIGGVDFNLVADHDQNVGTYTLSWFTDDASNLPLLMDFVFVSKAGADYGAYLFSAKEFLGEYDFGTESWTGEGEGTFEISWMNGNSTPGLSHSSVYGRIVESVVVSEPASIVLFGLGLVGLGFARRKLS